ncbi:pyridoxal phosphate-dependent aminotransferase [Kiloniella antarctica]|uniref:Aminotransferase n=1 Tax=Kiloniella antarctica TaxID=1550907 RepID=A0ABW5BKA3_9PROT
MDGFIASRVRELHPSGIRAVMTLAAERQARGLPVIHMEVGQPDFTTPEHIVEAAFSAVKNGCTGYTPNAGFMSLREAVAERVAQKTGAEISGKNICITTGGVMAIYLSLMSFVEPGDEVLVPDPGWPNYLNAISMAGGKSIPYALHFDKNYQPDIDELQDKITSKTRAIFINYPGNPTGANLSVDKMKKLLDFAERNNILLISDEIYEDFIFEGAHVSALSNALGPDPLNRVIMISGASKSYAMTGWRIGWMVANEATINAATRLVESIVSCPPAVSQAAAEAAVRGSQDCVKTMCQAYKRRSALAASILEPDGFLLNKPQGAFYAMVDISKAEKSSNDFVRELLENTGVAVAPGETFGSLTKSSVRISTAISDKDVIVGCRQIRDYLNQ